MRLCLYICLPLLFLAEASNAVDLNDLQALRSRATVKYDWIKPGSSNDPQPTVIKGFKADVRYQGPGNLLYVRTEHGKTASYQVKLNEIDSFYFDFKLHPKSTTCERFKPNTQCALHIQFPEIRYALVATNSSEPSLPDQSLRIENLPLAFYAKWLPELNGLTQLRLQCDDWSWLGHSIGESATILEMGTLNDNQINDLGTTTPTLSTYLPGPFRCTITNEGCVFNDLPMTSTPADLGLIGAFAAANITMTLDVPSVEGACTTAFGVEGLSLSANATASDYLAQAKKQTHHELDQQLPLIQGRLNDQFISAYKLARLEDILGNNSLGNTGDGGDVGLLTDYPWAEITGLIDTNSTASNSEGDKVILTIRLEDGLSWPSGKKP